MKCLVSSEVAASERCQVALKKHTGRPEDCSRQVAKHILPYCLLFLSLINGLTSFK